MSYEIIYDKQFIDLQDGRYIPMLLSGSNNCYEWAGRNGRERRERSWHNYSWAINGNTAGTLEEMEGNAIAWKEDKAKQNAAEKKDDGWWKPFDEKHWGYWTSLQIGSSTYGTTFGMYLGLFRTGCKKALTVEQLKSEGITINIYHYAYKTEEYVAKYRHDPWSDTPETTEEIIALIDKYEKHEHQASIRFSGMFDERPKYLRKKYFPKQRKEKEKVSQFFYVYATGYGPVRKITSRHMYNCYSAEQARKFKRESEANRYRNKLALRSFPCNFEVRKEESETLI